MKIILDSPQQLTSRQELKNEIELKFQPATPAQTRYLKFLIRQSGRNSDEFKALAYDRPDDMIKQQASVWIDWLLKEQQGQLIYQQSHQEVLNELELETEHQICGFDAFGDWESPYVCLDENHVHKNNNLSNLVI